MRGGQRGESSRGWLVPSPTLLALFTGAEPTRPHLAPRTTVEEVYPTATGGCDPPALGAELVDGEPGGDALDDVSSRVDAHDELCTSPLRHPHHARSAPIGADDSDRIERIITHFAPRPWVERRDEEVTTRIQCPPRAPARCRTRDLGRADLLPCRFAGAATEHRPGVEVRWRVGVSPDFRTSALGTKEERVPRPASPPQDIGTERSDGDTSCS